MKLSAQRETILEPLQAIIGVVEKRQTMPILANVLIVAEKGRVSMTATDLEVELVGSTELVADEEGSVTVPGRKLLDICKALPAESKLSLNLDGERLLIRSGRSRFTLSTLPADEFPTVEDISSEQDLQVSKAHARRLFEKTHFAMAHQDVRYYLNGLLLESRGEILRAVATDGHRLALCDVALDKKAAADQQVIVPRKGVLELQRLLAGMGDVSICIGRNHLQVDLGSIRFTSKLIDGRFPEYERVIPTNASNLIFADREKLRQSLSRAAILSNEKYRGIRLEVASGKLVIQAHNPEQEEAEEEIEVKYEGEEDLEVGFNVNYLLDALGAVDTEQVQIGLTDANSSCLITEPDDLFAKFVVMPMRL